MFCKNCGKQIPIDSKFCGLCGANNIKQQRETPHEESAHKNSVAREDTPLTEHELQIALLMSEAKKVATKMILGGIGWIAAGLVITGITYSIAEPGGSYYVFWGLSIYGAYRLIKGVYYKVAPHKLIEEALSNVSTESKQ